MRLMFAAVILAAGGCTLATLVQAHERPGPTRIQADGHDPMACYCRARGRMFAPGETVCLRTAEGSRVAECRMVTNVMSWSMTERPCPET